MKPSIGEIAGTIINDLLDAALAYRELAAYYNGRRKLDDELRERLSKADALLEELPPANATPTKQVTTVPHGTLVVDWPGATATPTRQGTTGPDRNADKTDPNNGRALAPAGQEVKAETCGQCEHLSTQRYVNVRPGWYPCPILDQPRRKSDPVCTLKEELEEWKATARALIAAAKSHDAAQQRDKVQRNITDNDDSLDLLDERIAREDIEKQLDLNALDLSKLNDPDNGWQERLELTDRFLDAVKHTDSLTLKRK